MTMAAPQPLWSFGYASIAPAPLSRPQLDTILETSQSANAQARVTGLLLHCDGSFLQVLEGPRAGVHHIVERIRRSPLHSDMRVLFDEPIAEREFGDWAMACKQVAPNELQVLRDAPHGSNRKLLAEYWKAWA
jgi:hypothetical protein